MLTYAVLSLLFLLSVTLGYASWRQEQQIERERQSANFWAQREWREGDKLP